MVVRGEMSRGTSMTPEEVARCIKDFLDGSGGEWDWDDFVSVPLDDVSLEAIRSRCAALPDRHPPTEAGHYCSAAGLAELRRLLASLRI